MLNILYRFTTPWAKANRTQLYINRFMGVIANVVFPVWCKLGFKTKEKRCDETIVVSLTSYPARIDKVYLCVESLLRQTIKPKHIILWLAREQFPHGIPHTLEKLRTRGLEIRYCKDYRSYKKIFETLKLYPDYNIVIADDDTLYPQDWLEKMIATANENKQCVICYRAAKMKLDESNRPVDGKEWDTLSLDFKGPSYLLSATGVGGVFYPKGFFEDMKVDSEKIISIAPTSDDYWLKVLSLYKKYRTVKVKKNSTEWFTIKGSQKTSLTSINSGNQKVVMDELLSFYEVDFSELIEGE